MPLPNSHLAAILDRFGASSADARLLGSSQNEVYACPIDGQPAVIRISVDRHRTLEQIEAELAWIHDLSQHGVPVCLPRPSPGGRLCERLTVDEQDYLAVRFDAAPGRPVTREDIDAPLCRELGRLTGRLHAAAMDEGAPAAYAGARQQWHESRLLNEDLDRYTHADAEPFRRCVRRMIEELQSVPVTPGEYGLIHADISFGNTFVDAGRLCIFDFDNCEHGWVAQDLATVLYDSIYLKFLNRVPPAELNDRIRDAWLSFLEGYASVRDAGRRVPELLKRFVILREAVIYIHYHRILNFASLTEAQRAGIDEMRQNVERGVMPFQLDR